MISKLAILLALTALTARADVKLPALFSDHMVLQRDAVVPVWGWAEPGENVTVSIASQTQSTKADAAGKWSVKLEKIQANEPLTLIVKGNNTLTVNDVLVGEVWLASGQSNMQMTVNESNDASKEKAAAKFPQIRQFTMPKRPISTPQADCEGTWIVCSPETAGKFSAAAYFFGRELHQKLKVPVGILNASVGETPIETWTSLPAQEGIKEFPQIIAPWKAQLRQPYDPVKALAQHEKQLAAWKIASEQRKAEGKPAGYPPPLPVHPREHKNYPGNLFNGMIAPLVPYAIRGGIWYQGENNCRDKFAQIYAAQLPLLIKDWRSRWGQGDFPFAWVQLPFYRPAVEDPSPVSHWATLRECQLRSLAVPNTGMAITIDTGDSNNVHPKDKQPVGHRLALWALAQVYGEKIPYSGPLPAGHKIDGEKIILSFKHANGGLTAKGGELNGFTLAGADKKWHWAVARIEGETVVVSSPAVKSPAAVRYGWADHPNCNLFNAAGLPASPFRTDAW